MKLEIEVTEDELRSAIERKARTAIADQTNSYSTDAYIRDQVKAHWHAAVDNLIVEEMYNVQSLREKIRREFERKLRLQLAAAVKTASKEENTTMTSFDDDICYCHDSTCPDKRRCYRYVNRAWGTWASHTATLRDLTKERCEYFIPIKRSKQCPLKPARPANTSPRKMTRVTAIPTAIAGGLRVNRSLSAPQGVNTRRQPMMAPSARAGALKAT